MYIIEKKHHLNQIEVRSNVMMTTGAAEVARRWWGIQKGLKSNKHTFSFWWKPHWNLEYQRLPATLLDVDPTVSFRQIKKRKINIEVCRLQL